MKWNDVEMIDGKFYVVDTIDNMGFNMSSWVFSFKNDNSGRFALCHVCVKRYASIESFHWSVYDGGIICHNNEIKNIRPATRDDMDYFWNYLDSWDYSYCLNTKKLRHVEIR